MELTREEFVKVYADRFGLPDHTAPLGYLRDGAAILVALPCDCEENCEGWAMLQAEQVDHHLLFKAPLAIRTAYAEATGR